MGKQTAVAFTLADERIFVDFLRSTAPIRLFVSLGSTVESLWVEVLDGTEAYGGFNIWNTNFEWSPEYGTVTADPSGARNGYRYVSNSRTAPVIEYSRHNFQNLKAMHGRVYWGKYFSGVPTYDVGAFDRWYSVVVRWLRKNGKQVSRGGAFNSYFLPDAWSKYVEAQQSAS